MGMLERIIKIVLILVVTISTMTPNIYAASTVKDVFIDADKFVSSDIDKDKAGTISVSEDSIQKLSKIVSGVLVAVGIIVALIMISIMGISFMAQSVEEKAKIKESMMPFLIGAIVTFGAFGIWRVAISIMSKIS